MRTGSFVNLQNVWITKQRWDGELQEMNFCLYWVYLNRYCHGIWNLETGWSGSLKGVSIELQFVKNDLRFSSGIMFASLEKPKLLKPEFMRDTSVV